MLHLQEVVLAHHTMPLLAFEVPSHALFVCLRPQIVSLELTPTRFDSSGKFRQCFGDLHGCGMGLHPKSHVLLLHPLVSFVAPNGFEPGTPSVPAVAVAGLQCTEDGTLRVVAATVWCIWHGKEASDYDNYGNDIRLSDLKAVTGDLSQVDSTLCDALNDINVDSSM